MTNKTRNISVKDETRIRLFNMKINEGYHTIDEVIQELLKKTKY